MVVLQLKVVAVLDDGLLDATKDFLSLFFRNEGWTFFNHCRGRVAPGLKRFAQDGSEAGGQHEAAISGVIEVVPAGKRKQTYLFVNKVTWLTYEELSSKGRRRSSMT